LKKIVCNIWFITIAGLFHAPAIDSCAQEADALANAWKEMNAAKDVAYEAYNDAKFGMFIHWGAYSELGGIWEGRKIPGLGEWIMYHARIPRDEYRTVCSEFNPGGFDAETWVRLARDAGMKYIVAMTKHHDGFSMYDSDVTAFNIYDYTDFKRDPIAELYEACQKYGIRLGLYYSHSIDWMDGGDAGYAQEKKKDPGHSDNYGVNLWDPSPQSYEEYMRTKAKPQMREILEKFPDLIEIWYDFPRFMNRQQSFDFYKLAFDIQPLCLIDSRVGNHFGDYLTAGDNQIPTTVTTEYRTWETPGTLNNTWGYKCYDNDWKSIEEVLYWIVEIASKGGNYLLNIGPDGSGYIPEESIELLHEVGRWMQLNGEAIYGTTRWHVFREGPTRMDMKSTTYREENGFDLKFTNEDFWFTRKDNMLYAISLVPPANGRIEIRALADIADQITGIELLGWDLALEWEFNEGVSILMPEVDRQEYEHGFALKIELQE